MELSSLNLENKNFLYFPKNKKLNQVLAPYLEKQKSLP